MQNFKERFNECVNVLKRVLNSKYFIFFTAAFFLFTYYLGLDLAAIYYVGISGTLMVLLLDDLTPLVGQFPFMNIMLSASNAPSDIHNGGSDYFFQTANIVQIGIVIGVYACAMIARMVISAIKGKLKINPVMIALFALCGAFLLNGAFGRYYKINDLAYGAIMTFFFLIVYLTVAGNVKVNPENIKRLAYDILVFSAVLIIELAVCYLTKVVFGGGGLDKEKIVFGWGIWNTMGMLLVVCIPFAFYLACKHKRGYLFFLYATLLLAAAIASTSRQAMLAGCIVYAVCWIIMIVKGNCRRINLIITAVIAVAVIIVAAVMWNKIYAVLSKLISSLFEEDGQFGGNGRIDLISQAMQNFLSSPVFGAGFFAPVNVSAHFVGLGGIIPDMYHNTIAEMLGACGIFGLLAYVGYRGVTVWQFIKNRSFDKLFIAISVCALLFMSLFDNHIFYILPTMFYSGFMAFVVGKPEENAGNKPEDDKETEAEEADLNREENN